MANRSYGPPAATARKHQITHFSGASAGNLNDGKLFRNFRFAQLLMATDYDILLLLLLLSPSGIGCVSVETRPFSNNNKNPFYRLSSQFRVSPLYFLEIVASMHCWLRGRGVAKRKTIVIADKASVSACSRRISNVEQSNFHPAQQTMTIETNRGRYFEMKRPRCTRFTINQFTFCS